MTTLLRPPPDPTARALKDDATKSEADWRSCVRHNGTPIEVSVALRQWSAAQRAYAEFLRIEAAASRQA